jgi:hypothetical protein
MTLSRVVHVVMAVLLAAALGVLPAACGPAGNSNVPGGQHDGPIGDGGGDQDVGPQPHTLTTIFVEPNNAILEVDLNTPATQAFTAKGKYADGVEEDLTSQVNWSSTNAALGDMTGATLNVPGVASAGAWITMIEARQGTVKGVAQLTVVAYRKTGNQTDFFFKLPYQDPGGNQQKPLDFHTTVNSLDVFFDMDVTGSMYGEISNLQTSLNTIVTQIRTEIPNTWFGVGAFADFPISPYGSVNAASECGRGGLPQPDQPFKLFLAMSDNATSVQTAVGLLSNGVNAPIWCGNDTPESLIESLYQVATGEGLTGPSPTNVPPSTTGIGGVQYRHGSMPVVIPISDSVSHDPGNPATCATSWGSETVNYAAPVLGVAHNRQQAKDKLNAICAKSVGIASIEAALGACTALADEEDFARATGAMVPPTVWDVGTRPAGCAAGQCCTGISGVGRATDGDGLCPLVFEINADGTGLGTSIVTGLKMLTRYAKFNVKTETVGNAQGDNSEPIPSPFTTANFIKQIQPTTSTAPTPPPTLPAPVIVGAEFHDVYPGSVVSFAVYAFNDFLPQTDQPQFFRAVIKVLAGGCTDLDQREVLILVPPKDIILG